MPLSLSANSTSRLAKGSLSLLTAVHVPARGYKRVALAPQPKGCRLSSEKRTGSRYWRFQPPERGAAPPENHHRCAGYAAPRKRADAQLPESRFRLQRAAERAGTSPGLKPQRSASLRRPLHAECWSGASGGRALRPRARLAWSTRGSRRTARWKAPVGVVRGAYSDPREARRLGGGALQPRRAGRLRGGLIYRRSTQRAWRLRPL
jgi:hypothetical protein